MRTPAAEKTLLLCEGRDRLDEDRHLVELFEIPQLACAVVLHLCDGLRVGSRDEEQLTLDHRLHPFEAQESVRALRHYVRVPFEPRAVNTSCAFAHVLTKRLRVA